MEVVEARAFGKRANLDTLVCPRGICARGVRPLASENP